MLRPLLTCCIFALLMNCKGHLDPDAKLVTDYFVENWWEIDILNYNTCFILQEEDDVSHTKNPIFLKKSLNDEEELFGTWNFEPPNTFYIYEDGEEPAFKLEVYEMSDCWSVEWEMISEVICACKFD